MLVRVSNPSVVLFLKLVFGAAGVGIAPLPELLDELFALFVRTQLPERAPLLVSDDIGDFLLEPLLIGALHLFLNRLLAAPLLFIRFFLGRRGEEARDYHASERHDEKKERGYAVRTLDAKCRRPQSYTHDWTYPVWTLQILVFGVVKVKLIRSQVKVLQRPSTPTLVWDASRPQRVASGRAFFISSRQRRKPPTGALTLDGTVSVRRCCEIRIGSPFAVRRAAPDQGRPVFRGQKKARKTCLTGRPEGDNSEATSGQEFLQPSEAARGAGLSNRMGKGAPWRRST